MKKIFLTALFALLLVSPLLGQDQTVTLTTTGQGENLQQATDNALRSAIEQTFGAFISSRTEILNDELMSDQIASVSSGNIQSYQVLSQTQLSENLWSVAVNAVVSVTKLTSFVQARGVQVEIQGGLFAANIRQQVLNEEAEIVAVRSMVGVLHELLQTAFDYEIEVGNPTATDATNSNWKIPITITASANDNMVTSLQYLQSTLSALSMTPDQVTSYKELNKDVYTVVLHGLLNNSTARHSSTTFTLRHVESFRLVEVLSDNLFYDNYTVLFVVDSGLDRKIGDKSDFDRNLLWQEEISKKREKTFYYSALRNVTAEIRLLATGQRVATFKYDDQRTLDELNKLTEYIVKPLGVISRVQGGDVYNPITGKTWMDRNLGALWPAISPTDIGAYGDFYTFEKAQTACPQGYRLPTENEWNAELVSWSANNAAGAFASPLKLPMAGYGHGSSGSLFGIGSRGSYWSSRVSGSNARFLRFTSSSAFVRSYYRAYDYSVRCLRD